MIFARLVHALTILANTAGHARCTTELMNAHVLMVSQETDAKKLRAQIIPAMMRQSAQLQETLSFVHAKTSIMEKLVR